MSSEKKTVLLYSGGMDSFICNFLFEPDILLYIKTGSRYEEKELKIINAFDELGGFGGRLIIVDASSILGFELDNAHIPLRNLFFIEIASFYGDIVYLCALRGETSKDKTNKFRKMAQNIISYCWDDVLGLQTKRKVKIEFPVRRYTKTKLLKKYIKKGGDVEDLENFTVSCYDNKHRSCGWCISCLRRWVAEINNGLWVKWYWEPKWDKNPYWYYYELMKQYKGIWRKIFIIFTKRFWVNLISNLELLKARRVYLRKVNPDIRVFVRLHKHKLKENV